ncbi:MAG: ComEA family DNA-binding protein [Acidimicrobiia bacterium]|nr:ComEA family DNA-binding protein [Acidimicrobiia bacterium]
MERTYWVLAALLLITAMGAGVFFGLWRPRPPKVSSAEEGVVSLEPTELDKGGASGEERMVVHVSGRVLKPGLVWVHADARVGDVIMAAGGALSDARLGDINLAAPVVDGGQVMVPGPRAGSATGDGGDQIGPATDDRVNINQATSQELERVPGLGPVLARRIVDYRDANGLFNVVEDLLDVSGIGEKKLAGLRDYVAVP